jgi:hypothetical protein
MLWFPGLLGDGARLKVIPFTLLQLFLALMDLREQDQRNRKMIALAQLLIERGRGFGGFKPLGTIAHQRTKTK